MKTNYVLIDYENVQPDAISVLDAEHFRVVVFVGASQSKVAYEIASALQPMGDRAEYVKISGNGSNALDFHIAYYIGHLASRDPEAYFHVVSKDTGFDPLIQHLKSRKILCSRSSDVADIPIVKAAHSKSPDERLAVIVGDLERRGDARPRTAKTLTSTINALFQKQLPDQEVEALLAELQRRGVVKVDANKVTYTLPG